MNCGPVIHLTCVRPSNGRRGCVAGDALGGPPHELRTRHPLDLRSPEQRTQGMRCGRCFGGAPPKPPVFVSTPPCSSRLPRVRLDPPCSSRPPVFVSPPPCSSRRPRVRLEPPVLPLNPSAAVPTRGVWGDTPHELRTRHPLDLRSPEQRTQGMRCGRCFGGAPPNPPCSSRPPRVRLDPPVFVSNPPCSLLTLLRRYQLGGSGGIPPHELRTRHPLDLRSPEQRTQGMRCGRCFGGAPPNPPCSSRTPPPFVNGNTTLSTRGQREQTRPNQGSVGRPRPLCS